MTVDESWMLAQIIAVLVVAATFGTAGCAHIRDTRANSLFWFALRVVIPVLGIVILVFHAAGSIRDHGAIAPIGYFSLGSAAMSVIEVGYRTTVQPRRPTNRDNPRQ